MMMMIMIMRRRKRRRMNVILKMKSETFFVVVILLRTLKDIEALESCEIPPIRTTFVEDLGEGAFGRVHKAILTNGLELFTGQQGCSKRRKEQYVAVKELHGEP